MTEMSAEHHLARCGHITASRMGDLMATLRSGGSAASRAAYKADLVIERLTGVPQHGYQSAAMLRGIEMQSLAQAAYEFYLGVDIAVVEYVPHPHIPLSGCSPDGLVGDEGLVEYKCPLAPKHIDTLITQKIDLAYILQCQWQLACHPKRKWVDFVSFHPDFPEEMTLYVQRLPRDTERIAQLEQQVEIFSSEIDQTVKFLRKQYPNVVSVAAAA